MSLFQGLEQFRSQLDAVNVQIVFRKDGSMAVTVQPVVAEGDATKNPHLAQPFSLVASANELDAEFVGSLVAYSDTRGTLAEQAAKQAEALKLKAAATPKPSASKGQAKGSPKTNVLDDVDDDGQRADPTGDDAGDEQSKPAVPPKDDDHNQSLFD